MAELGKLILEFRKKVEICSRALKAAGLIEKTTKANLALAAGLDFQTLKSAYVKGRISPEMEDQLATLCRFDKDDPAWCDRAVDDTVKKRFLTAPPRDLVRYLGRDTAKHFERAMAAAWHPLSLHGMLSPETDVNFAVINIVTSRDEFVATKLDVLLQIDMKPGYSGEDCAFGFTSVYVYLLASAGASFAFDAPLGQLGPINLSDILIEARGTLEVPYWKLLSEEGIINGRYWFDKPLISLRNPSEGDGFSAEIRVQLRDGSLIWMGEENAISASKKAVISRLLAREISSPGISDGWITLAKQELRVVRRGQK